MIIKPFFTETGEQVLPPRVARRPHVRAEVRGCLKEGSGCWYSCVPFAAIRLSDQHTLSNLARERPPEGSGYWGRRFTCGADNCKSGEIYPHWCYELCCYFPVKNDRCACGATPARERRL
jgi:hypothetical protein